MQHKHIYTHKTCSACILKLLEKHTVFICFVSYVAMYFTQQLYTHSVMCLGPKKADIIIYLVIKNKSY